MSACREIEMKWAWRSERIAYEHPSDEMMSVWEGVNQAGEKVRVYIRRIEIIDDESNVVQD